MKKLNKLEVVIFTAAVIAFAGLFILIGGCFMGNETYKIVGLALSVLCGLVPSIIFIVSLAVDTLFYAIAWLKEYHLKHYVRNKAKSKVIGSRIEKLSV